MSIINNSFMVYGLGNAFLITQGLGTPPVIVPSKVHGVTPGRPQSAAILKPPTPVHTYPMGSSNTDIKIVLSQFKKKFT